jgi:hypothetical protein
MKYTEHAKLEKVKDQSQAIGEFLDGCGYLLAQYNQFDELVPIRLSTEKVLADYFEIDLERLEKEKRHMLDQCRKAQGDRT